MLLASAIENCHSKDNPVMFDLTKSLPRFSKDCGEILRIGAMALRDLLDSSTKRERAYKWVISFVFLRA